jgi:hypothetical protein
MIVERRFERLRQENDLRNQRICEGFRRSEQMLGLVNEEPDQWEKMDG